MEKLKKPWYEFPQQKEFVLRSSREAPRSFLYNLWIPKLLLGKAAIGFLSIYLKEQLTEEERKVLIIVDANLETLGTRVERSLSARGFNCKIWNGVLPEVPLETINNAVKICEEFNPRVLIAVGGGSTLDTAKLVFLMYEQPNIDYYNLIPINALGLRKKIKHLIAIPTTSGTGAEATFASMIMDTTQKPPKKVYISTMEILPDIAILSTEFVENMPSKLTAWTGIDAIVHAMSAYFSSCHNTLSDLISLDAIRLILKYLPRAYKRGRDTEAREKMQIAAFLSGVAICNSGVAMEHSLGHSLGSVFEIHHGLAVGLYAPYVFQFISKNTDRYITIAKLFGINTEDKSKEVILQEFVKKYKEFLRSIDCPTSISELKEPKIEKEDYIKNLERLVQLAHDDLSTWDALRYPNKEDIRKIFTYAYDGKDVDF